MKRIILFVMHLNLLWLAVNGQSQQIKMDGVTAETEKHWAKWHKDQYEVGIRISNDSLVVGDESKKILSDEAYRKLIYPEMYSWQATVDLLQKLELKKAFWYLLNLYETDTARKQLVLESIVAYEMVMETDKLLVSSFYTYGLLDPRVTDTKGGKVQIQRPDLLDRRFAQVKEIVSYIIAYRKSKATKKP